MDAMTGKEPSGFGRVTRVNGPLVQVEGLGAVRMLDVVEIGEAAIQAETVALAGPLATLQAYEYTGGIRVGDVAGGTGLPLARRWARVCSGRSSTGCSGRCPPPTCG